MNSSSTRRRTTRTTDAEFSLVVSLTAKCEWNGWPPLLLGSIPSGRCSCTGWSERAKRRRRSACCKSADSEEIIFDATRPVILTGIEDLAARPDLVDRSLIFQLPEIDSSRRRTEATLWKRYQ